LAVTQEWNDAVEPVINAVGRRFSQLYLKDEIVEVTQVAASNDVVVMTETLLSICDNYSKDHQTQVEMRRMPKVQLHLKMGIIHQSTSLSEARGNCSRAPVFLKTFLKYPIPHAWMNKAVDQHYMSFEDVLMNQMLSSTATNERFCLSIIRKSDISSVGTQQGNNLDADVRKVMKTIFHQHNVIMARKCHLCLKPRFIYSPLAHTGLEDAVIDTERYLDCTLLLQCGMPLFP
jgi:hypothetical protein